MSSNEFFGELRRQVDAGATAKCLQIAQRLRGRLFKQQLDFINDPARHKALLCPRRSGKSYVLAAGILIYALEHPHSNIVFIAKTRDKAREILWDGEGQNVVSLKKMNKDFEIGIHFSEVHTSGLCPNGSTFRLRGCETIADIEQFRGEPFNLVVLDECASFSPGVLDPLINRALEPTLGDYLGTMVLAGTPGAVLAGTFYQVTSEPAFEQKTEGVVRSRPYSERDHEKWLGVEYGWSFHSWTRRDNVILPHLWDEALRVKKLNGWTDSNPVWIREYLGRWVPDDTNLVYRFNPEANTWKPGERSKDNPFGLPKGHVWKYVAGMDFGTKDPFALQVVAYSETHPHLFQVYEFVQKGLLPPGFAAAINRVQEIVALEWMVGDFGPFGDMLQEQMAQEYGLSIEKAIKKDKRDHIELLNGDFIDGRCFVLEGSEVARQMLYLSWDDLGLKEKSGQRNDACDALVYTWRRTWHHYSEDPIEQPKPGSPEYQQAQEQAEIEAVAMREIKSRNPEGWYDSHVNDGDSEELGW